MSDSRQVNINLIGKPKESFSENFFRWAINIGRMIIIVTELVAVGALIYRFTLDRKIIDLHDQIKKSSIFVTAQTAKEQDYRNIQSRLTNIKDINVQTQEKISIMNNILKALSTGAFSSSNITVSQNSISIKGVAFSIFPINDFINSLKQNPNITSISLDDVSSTSEGIEFKMTMELKQQGNNLTLTQQ